MHFTSLVSTAAFAGLALAANTDVKVSNNNGDLTYTPSNITAAKGDTVTFKFYPKAHSVVQSTFADPCQPMSNGFWSGFVNVSSGVATTEYMITVNDTKPIWFYCSQGKHCQSGMVGAINAPTTGNTLDSYMSAAKSASSNVSPSEANGFGGMLMQVSGSSTMSMSTASATGTAASATGTGAASSLDVSKVALSGAAAFLGYLLV